MSAREARDVVCLFLAQNAEPETPHSQLGFKTQSEAFTRIAAVFGTKPNTIKLERDAFDNWTDSGRIGWQRDLPPRLTHVWDKYSALEREELLRITKEILGKEWPATEESLGDSKIDLFQKIESATSKTEIKPAFTGDVVNFSNTRNNWFAATIDQLTGSLKDVLGKIDSFREAGEKYDEALWRKAFSQHLTDEVARALAGTQTFPFFSLLAKIIHYANSDSPYEDSSIDLDPDKIRVAVAELERIASSGPGEDGSIDPERLTGGENIIYYGAPGIGKSYTVDGRSKGDSVVRTVFHPDVQNSDFVGTLKPVREKGEITYRFSPGPFSVALAEAMNNPGKKVWLVIEELNRAPAASVFGDLFLLLDRDGDGRGEYDVNCPSEEFASWYAGKTGDGSGKIRLPSNLWIAATMNSADQGVFPLDTAFRRRWTQIYIPVVYDKGPFGKIKFVANGGIETKMEWGNFVATLNEHLTKELKVAEDRLVGPWFVKEAELGGDENLPGKVLIYLWDDLLRHHGRNTVFSPDILTYGKLAQKVAAGTAVFSEAFLEKLAVAAPAAPDAT